ncbi:CbtB domain-containing protein [Novosphingobium aerophilum]|uniref:CbtB domain-containing protein n=1 Tax=Novosphingobium TaxID=165696 RepID=UPI0010F2EF54|nr:CbtB-domain containing protein [Novosphingobium sp. ST904]TCM41327.1 putative cobalt transporter subunit CbtB [Novosphingobium sp. ST904]
MAVSAAIFDDTFIPVEGGSAIPIEDIAPWAVLGTLLALIFLYFVSTEQGAFSLFQGMYVHEFVHDGRHLLGFPCH